MSERKGSNFEGCPVGYYCGTSNPKPVEVFMSFEGGKKGT
jgi:hypothetical protein